MSASANTKNTQADLESKSGRPSSPKPTPWVDRQRSEGSLVSASADREPRSRPVTPDPKRVNLGDRATPGEQSGREQALVESRRQSKPLTLSDKGPAVRSGQDAEDRAPAGGSLSDTKQSKSTQKRPVTPDPAPVQPEGKPSLAQQDAKQKGMGWFQRKGKQTDKPSQPAATVFLDSPEAQAPASERSRSDSKEPGVSQGPSSSKLPLSGRAPPGEHEAEMKAKAELKRKSQQTQPYKPVDREQLKGQGTGQAEDQQLGMSPEQAAAVYKPRPAISKQDQSQQQPELLSDSDQTSDLGSSLASSSMSAEPPISSAGSVAEPSSAAQRDQSPNRVRGFFSAVQDRVSGRKPAQSPRNTAAQTDLPSSPMQVSEGKTLYIAVLIACCVWRLTVAG